MSKITRFSLNAIKNSNNCPLIFNQEKCPYGSDFGFFKTNSIVNNQLVRFKSTNTSKKQVKPSENRSAQSKGYLMKKKGPAGSGGSDGKVDRFEAIRKILYEKDPENSEWMRLKSLKQSIPDPEIHKTIHRAMQLFKRHKRLQVDERLERQYLAMDSALENLRQNNLKLYLKTVKDENGTLFKLQNINQPSSIDGININSLGKLVGLFPRQIRIPTELPPEDGKIWDSDWKNPADPLK